MQDSPIYDPNESSSLPESDKTPTAAPWADLETPSVDPELLDSLRDELIRVGTQTCDESGKDLTKFIELARSAGAVIEPALSPEEAKIVHFPENQDIIHSVADQIFLPRNELIVINTYDGTPALTHGIVRPESWVEVPYLKDRNIWHADLDWKRSPAEQFGMSYGDKAFVDPDGSIKDAKNFYEMLNSGKLAPDSFQDLLYRTLKRAGIDGDAYAQLLGVERIRGDEIQRVKDNILGELICGDRRFDNRLEHTKALLKPSSTLASFLDRKKEDRYFTEVCCAAVGVFSANLQGVIVELERHLDQRKPDLALCSVLDYMAIQHIRFQVRDLDMSTDPRSIYHLGARFLFSGLADQGARCYEDFANQVMVGSYQKSAEAARNLLVRVRDVDLISPAEREELFGE